MMFLKNALMLGVLFSFKLFEESNPSVPLNDPTIDTAEVPVLLESVRDVHPRLIVTSNNLSSIQALYNSPEGAAFRADFDGYLPSCYAVPSSTAFLTDATQGQVQGLWRIPTVGLHYRLTGDTASRDAVIAHLEWLHSLPSWETGGELDSGMSAGNILCGAALGFDWVYNDLDPLFREQFRHKLWYQARAMYYAGHLGGSGGSGYWTNDPQNNHRWHRDAGLALAVLAAYDGRAEQGWMLKTMLDELQLVADWLPDDGTSHESASYLCFGGAHLTLALQAADECLGTEFLEQDFFKNTPGFVLSSLSPELPNLLPYGDTGGSLANYSPYLWKAIAEHNLPDEQDAMTDLYPTLPSWCDAFAWMSLVWYDSSVSGGSTTNRPLNSFWPDVGIAYARTGWDSGAEAAMFKCGPFGGYKLNEYREVVHSMGYINVAHDDPDANSFVLYNDGELTAETDRYSYAKQSQNYNTILINNIGQFAKGRTALPYTYSQPATGGTDMREMGVVTAWLETNGVVAVEGEAAGSYLAGTVGTDTRPALDRFRRTFLWVEDQYVLVLDDIRCAEPVDVTWQMQGQNLTAVDAPSGKYRLTKNSATCDFQLVSDGLFSASVTNSLADDRNTSLGWKQLQAVASDTASIRFASVYDLWGKGDLSVSLASAGSDQWTVSVTGTGVDDSWDWQAATGQYIASSLSATHQAAGSPFFIMNSTNSVPSTP